MTLKSFPRGGDRPIANKFSNQLYEWESRSKYDKKHKVQTKRNVIIEDPNIIVTIAERLSNLTLCEGMVVLGRISKATEYELIVSIPGGLLGRVQVTDVGESYTTLLQSIIDKKEVQSDGYKSLPDLYDPGDYVVCYVKNVNPEGKWLYNLSLEPQLINQNIDISYLEKGARLVCAIKSIEDHGYVVETGVANVRAFIATKNVDEGKQYCNQVFCVIKEIKAEDRASVVTLSAKKKKIDSASAHGVSYLDALTPGTKLSLCVTKILSNGLQVGFGKNVGYINQIYLDNSLSTYTENMELNGTLLYITPVTKLAYFSLLTDISEKEKLNVGDHVKEAKVLFRESNGIMLKFSKSGLRGFVSLRRTDVPFAKISTDFKPGSIHECRILSYNWSEHFYVCTMETRMLKEKYFSISDLSLGDILTVRITNVDRKSGFVRVQAGKIYGVATPEHVSDSGLRALKNLRNGDYVAARVLHTNDRRGIKFTLKPSLIKSELEILHDIHEARRGSVHHGTITMINKYGLLVKFYGDAKGWVPRALLNKDTANMNWNYAAGQTVKVSIESVQKDEGKMILKMADEAQKEQELVNMSIGELVEGTIVDSSVEGAHLRIHKGDGESAIVITGFLPAGHMSPCGEIGGLLASKYAPGDLISAYVFVTKPSVILSRTYVTQENYRRFEALKVGDCIPCTIMDVLPDGVRVALPIDGHSIFDFVSYKNISNFETLRANQIMFVKIAAIDTQRGQLSLTMALKDVWESSLECGNKMTPAVDVLSLYLNKLAELSTNPFYKDKPIAFATLGQKVNGHIEKITEHGLVLRLDNDLTGMVRKDHYSGEPKVGDKVFGTVLWKNYVHELVDVSLLPRIVNGISSKQKTLPQLPDSLVLKAEIVMITNWLILVLVKRNGTGYLAALPARRHVNDTSPDLTPYVLHAKVRVCIVLNRDDNVVPICVLKSTLEVSKEGAMAKTANKKSKRKASAVQDAKAKKLKTDDDDDEDEEMESEHDDDNRKRSWKEGEKRKDEGNRIKDIDEYSEVDSSSDEGSMEEDEVLSTAEEKSHVPECGFNWDEKWNSIVPPNAETSSDEDDDEEESVGQEPKQKKKKLSAAERREQERQKEREIRQREEALASNQMPNSVDQFDRLILSSPDSSLVWLQYMTYHVQATEIDKARAVARRALKTINFREENERLIMWNGWLNLESRFGTPESLNDVFQEALKVNDVQKVYSHMLTVHAEAGRHAELEKLIGTIIGKFKQDPQMWGDCGHVLYKVGLTDKSRHLMRRALQSLPNSKHVNLMVRFAIMENNLGDRERAQTLFEQILTSYPKRVDVWSSYIDCLVKYEDIDIARRVLERAVVQTLPARKMKTLFNKFKSFEEKYGTPESVAHVQQLAADYVEKQCNKDLA